MDIKEILKNESSKYNKIQTRVNGFTQVLNWFIESKKYTIYEKQVYYILKRHKMNKKTCWPSIKTIARKVPCSESTVKKAIKGLLAKEMVTKEHIKRRSNVYSNFKA